MNNNYQVIKTKIRKFCFEKLKNNQEPLQRFEELNRKNNRMIQDAKITQILSAAVIYSYLRENGLNGKGGISTKDLAEYFEIKPQAVTSKVFDVDCIINPGAIFPERDKGFYEFIDDDRFEVSEEYYEFLESPEADDYKKSEKILLSLIKKDPDFFDTYTVLHEYYLNYGKGSKAYNLMKKAYERAMNLVLNKNGKFPDSLPWGFIENRHIIRAMFNFAALLWFNREKQEALKIFQDILKSNPNDNIGARYAIVGLLDGEKSLESLEERFDNGDGYLDWQSQEKWFFETAQKYQDEIGWWFDEIEDLE